MAREQTKRRAAPKSSRSAGSKGSQRRRRASAKPHQDSGGGNSGSGGDGSRRSPLRAQTGEGTVPEREYQDYTLLHPGSISDTDEPDVLLDVPVVKVDEIHFELDNLEARISVHAEVLDLVKLSVGVHAELGKVELSIKGVEAQALLRARLDHVTAIIDRVLTTLDRNPALLESIGRSLEQVGAGAGEGVGQAVGGLGQGAAQLSGQLAGAGASGAQGGNGAGGGPSDSRLTGGRLAKEAAKLVARELGAAASEEAKELGLAATHKAAELGERRRQRRATKHDATDAARREAEATGIALDGIEGSGVDGRITLSDVKEAVGAE